MLTKIKHEEIPRYRAQERSPQRAFAAETLSEFMEGAEVGDVSEITGAPRVSDDPVTNADRVLQALKSEIFYRDLRGKVKAFRRRERMFIERTEPFRPRPLGR